MRKPAESRPASFTIADGRTTVPLHLEPWGTVFVVFRKPAEDNVAHAAATIDGVTSCRRWMARGR